MGKNKNKKYDLASRQEKILKRMAKPLYKKSDDSAYLVITQPFGMHPNPAERGTVDVNRLSSWISWVFRRDSVVETVYAISHPFPSSPQRDEVIVKIAEGVHPAVILGKHKYKNILNAGWPWDPSPESCVFIYNYQSNGDPSYHNWRESIASNVDVPPHHFRNPYPTPIWAFRPSHLSALALTLPDSLPRTPEPSPEPPGAPTHTRREDVKPEPSYSSSKVTSSGSHSAKVEPSSQTNSSITPGEPCTKRSDSDAERQPLRLPRRVNSLQPDVASIRVKQEPFTQIEHELSNSDPTRSRSEAYDTPVAEEGVGHSNAPPLGVKQEPQDDQSRSSVASPSKALWDVWARYQSRQQGRGDPGCHVTNHHSAGPMKQEPHTLPQSAAHPATQSSGNTDSIPRGPLPSFKTRREPEEGEDVQPWKRPKTEIN
ncbi:hypothetical protein F5888DRAFT_1630391 [Russula emetica]|nr:hypothetical protein F5888DRAFT_1630391 [Russula emetica]